MGVTIHYGIGVQKGRVKSTLDRTEKMAREMKGAAEKAAIPFTIRRPDMYSLLVDIGKCETLAFEFLPIASWKALHTREGWNYENSCLVSYFGAETLTDNESHLANWPEQRKYWCAAFCKTQFSDTVAEHRMVAELVRSVAAFSDYTHVSDEGDYYHTGEIADAEKAIGELGVMMSHLGMALGTAWGADNVVIGGQTKIRPRKSRV